MWTAVTTLFSNTVGKHNKDANDWFGPNSWWGKITGKSGQVIKEEVGRDLKSQAQNELITKVLIGYIVYKSFLD